MNGENTRTYLAFAAIAISFFCVVGLFFIEMPEKNRDLINVALGAILGWSGTVVAFYFGPPISILIVLLFIVIK